MRQHLLTHDGLLLNKSILRDKEICKDKSQPSENGEYMVNPQTPNMDGSLDIDFAKFPHIDVP